ncbi:MAG: DMT family transporter [Mycobacteriales bacterium]
MAASLAIYSALGAAACFGVGNALQHRSALSAPARHFLRPRLLAHLVTRPLWLTGTLLAAAGLGLHVLALDFGQLAVVQPLLVTSLLFALPASAALDRRWVRRKEIFWALVTLAGLTLFLVIAAPSPAHHRVDLDEAGLVLVPVLLLVGFAALLARHGTPRRRALALGLSTGACFGVLAALVKVVLYQLSQAGFLGLLTSWPLYGLLAIGGVGLVLNMSAFQAGPLGASFAALTIVDPLVSIALGIAGFGERLTGGGLAVALEACGLLVMSVGVAATAQFATGRSGLG